MKRFQLFFCFFLFILCNLNAQVGIGTTSPDASSSLHVTGANKGILIPSVRLTSTSVAAPVVTPATSLLIYNTRTLGSGGTAVTPGYYFWDSSQWVRLLSGVQNITAQNGLRLIGPNNNVRLGGGLTENTTITHGAFSLTHNLSSIGDFHIADNGINRFSVLDNGRTVVGGINNSGQFNVTGNSYFSDDLRLRDGAVNSGDVLIRLYDSADDGIIDIYENNAYNIRLHGNGASVFNEQGIITNDFRIESNTQANMFFIDAGTNEIGIRTNSPSSMLHMTNGGANVGSNAMAKFENLGTQGVVVSGVNTTATNVNNAIEGVTSYNGNSISAGVFGLGSDLSLTHRAVGVRGAVNGRDGIGVFGTRQITGGSGWAGLFQGDLGYTGFFGVASDENLKKNIKPIKKALNIVNQLNPVTYDFDLEKHPGMGLNKEMEYGFIAQEVERIMPEIVREKNLITNANVEMKPNEQHNTETEKFMVMDYTRIIPVLTKAIQEQQVQIEELKKRVEQLENK